MPLAYFLPFRDLTILDCVELGRYCHDTTDLYTIADAVGLRWNRVWAAIVNLQFYGGGAAARNDDSSMQRRVLLVAVHNNMYNIK
jgi:hypothetical protein